MISMTLSPRKPTRVTLLLTAMLVLAVPHLLAAERSNINITGYVIDAQLDPAEHTLKATARVTFTATDTVSAAIFELHNALKVDSVTDEQRHRLCLIGHSHVALSFTRVAKRRHQLTVRRLPDGDVVV